MSAAASTSRSRSRSSTTAWATAARSRRRSSTSARARASARDHERAARGRRPGRARRRRVPARDGEPARARPGRAAARARRRRARRCSASASACSSRSSTRASWAARTASGSSPARCAPLQRRRAEAAAHRLERGRASRRPDSPLIAELPARCAFYHVHSLAPVPARRRGRARHRRVRRAVRHAPCSAAPSTACSSTPRSPRPPGLRLLANFARICIARAQCRVGAGEALPGDRHPRAATPCASSRATSTPRRSTTRTRSRRRCGWVRTGASACTWSTSTGRKAGEPVNLEHLRADRRRERVCPCSTAAGCAARLAIARGARGRRGARDPRDRRLHRPGAARCARWPSTARSSVAVSVDVRGGLVATARLAADERRRRRARPSRRCASGACGTSSSPNIDHDGMLDGANREEVDLRLARRRATGSADLLGRHRQRSTTCEALAALRAGAARAPRRRDRRQGAVRGALHGRRGAVALAG